MSMQAKTDRTEKRKREIYYYDEILQHPLSIIDRSSRKKINKYDPNSTIGQLDLIDSNRIFHPTT